MSIISDDFPEPETQVTTLISPSRIETSIFFKLFSEAQSISIHPDGVRFGLSTYTCFRQER